MNEQFTYLYSVLRHLASAEIPYMLTGSMALAVWAQPRMTRDIDLVIRADGRKVARLVDALQNDNYVSDDAAQEAVRSGTMFNAIDFVTLNKADFILYNDSPYEHEKFERTHTAA